MYKKNLVISTEVKRNGEISFKFYEISPLRSK